MKSFPTANREWHARVLADEFFPASPVAVAPEDIFRETVQWLTHSQPISDSSTSREFLDAFTFEDLSPEDIGRVRRAIEELYFSLPDEGTARKKRTIGILPLTTALACRFKPNAARRLDRFVAMLAYANPHALQTSIVDLLGGMDESEQLKMLDPLGRIFVEGLLEFSSRPGVRPEERVARPWCFRLCTYFISDFERLAAQSGRSRNDQLAAVADLIGIYIAFYYIRFAFDMHNDVQIMLDIFEGRGARPRIRACETVLGSECECVAVDLFFTRPDRPVKRRGPAVMAWRSVESALINNYFELIAIKRAIETAQRKDPNVIGFFELISRIAIDSQFRGQLDAGLWEAAREYAGQNSVLHVLPATGAGIRAFMSALQEVSRGKSVDNQSSTTGSIRPVRQLLKGRSCTFVSSRQGVGTFFTIDSNTVELLVMSIVPRVPGKMRLADFYAALRARFWLTPSTETQDYLSDLLAELGLLQRFSDSGDAQFVLAEPI